MPSIKVGDRVWRSVEFSGNGPGATPTILRVRFQRARNGPLIVRAFNGSRPRPAIASGWVAHSGSHGVVCRCWERLPERWTHFLVTRVSRDGMSATVTPVRGPHQELLDQYGFTRELRSA